MEIKNEKWKGIRENKERIEEEREYTKKEWMCERNKERKEEGEEKGKEEVKEREER
jgi:hypothetical protein